MTTDSHLKSLVITDDAKFISGGKRTNFLLSSDDVKAVFDITGGYFSKDPTGYEKDGYIAVASDNLFHVVKKADKAADIIPGPADVKAETTGKTPEEAAAIQSVVEALNNTPPAAAGLNGAAGEAAQKTDNTVTEDALKKAQDAISSSTTAESLNIVVEPYVEVAVTGVTEEEGKKVLSLNIEAKYNVVATTAADGTPLVKPVDGATGVNAVNLSEGNPMTVNTPVEITVAVPANTFANDTNLYVKHTKSGNKVYYYKATLADNKVTFTTEHGFSPFAISEDTRTATVKFVKEDTTTSTVTYGPADVASAFPTDTKSGYSFDGWKFTGVEGATGTYKTLTDDLLTKLSEANAKASPIEAKPVFSSSSWDDFGSGSTGTSYTITASAGEGGTISPNGKVSVSSGSDKTFTIAASTGYGIADVKVDGVSVGAVKTYTFEDVKKAHTIEASFKKLAAEGTFSDVNTGDWFYDAVQYAYSHELMNGVGDGKFDPNGTTTRGMIVTILYRLEEEPAAQAASFTDVAADAYYAKAVAWAAEKGIVKGYSAAQFAPNDAITREQMASILYRYAQSKNYDVTGTAKLDGYTDAASISDYALTAMQWANAEKLIQGVTDTTIVPQGNATRAQVATILMRFIENVAK